MVRQLFLKASFLAASAAALFVLLGPPTALGARTPDRRPGPPAPRQPAQPRDVSPSDSEANRATREGDRRFRSPYPEPAMWRLRPALPAPRVVVDTDAPVIDVAREAALTTRSPEDLDPTIDVQITQEIIDKATELGSVEAMYEFVRNECDFQPYYGSQKGSVETLHQRAGNDYDLASLLIALLRASNVPARYAEGVVEMPIARATSWLGVDSVDVAASILYTNGMEGVTVVGPSDTTCCVGHGTPGCDTPAVEACVCAQDPYCCDTAWDSQCASEVEIFGCGSCVGDIEAVRARRIWVEAWAARGHGSPAWVPLDPAFAQTTVDGGLDVPEEMGLDAQAFIDNYWDPTEPEVELPRPVTPLELLKQDLQNYLDANHPGMTIADAMRTHELASEQLGVLPASLPYKVRSREAPYSEIPAARRYQIRFHLHNDGTTLIDHTLDLPTIAGKRVTIDFVGATSADQSIIDSYGGIYQTPPSLVNLKPVLRLDGQDVSVGASGVGMGRTHDSDIHFLAPTNASGLPQNVVPAICNTIVTGASQAIGFAVQGVPERLLLSPPEDDTEGLASLRFDTAMDYLSIVERGDRELGRIMHTFVTTDVADAIVENVVNVTYDIFGVPQTFVWKGLRVDADRSVLGIWPVDHMDEPDQEPKDFMIISGAEGSLHESLTYEKSYGQDSVSTVKILEQARANDVTVYKRWSTLPLPANTLSASDRLSIENAIRAGHVVTFPADPLTVGGTTTGQWTGAGWIDMDPADGAAGYIISGRSNGGATVEVWPPEFIDLSEDDREVRRVGIEITRPAHDSPDGDAIFTRDHEQTLVFEYKVHVTYDDGSTRTLPGGSDTYKRETRNTTRTFRPDNYAFTVWIARSFWWFSNETIAEAERRVSIAGALVRGPDGILSSCRSQPERNLLVTQTDVASAPAQLQACVYPDKDPSGGSLASGYSWSGGPKLRFLSSTQPLTEVGPSGTDPSAQEEDQAVDVVVQLSGGKTVHGARSLSFESGGSDKRHKMTVIKLLLRSVDYLGAGNHVVSKTGAPESDWIYDHFQDDGHPIDYAEWQDTTRDGDPEVNDPVCYTRTSSPAMVAVLESLPEVSKTPLVDLQVKEGSTILADAKGVAAGAPTSVVTLQWTLPLPNTVANAVRNLEWVASAHDQNTYARMAWTATHFFVTYAAPETSPPTAIRLDWCTDMANGATTPDEIGDRIGPDAVGGTHFGPKSIWGSPPSLESAWQVLDGEKADCGTLSRLMKYELDLLGATGSEVRFVYARHASWGGLDQPEPPSGRESDGQGHWLGMWFAGGLGGGWNNYEGCCVFRSKWWEGGNGTWAASAYSVLLEVTLPNTDGMNTNHQAWDHDRPTAVAYPPGTP